VKLSEQVREFKTKLVRLALERTHGNIRKAARQCGESPMRMQRWVHALGLGDFAADLRRRRAWWLVDRSVLVGVFITTCVYAAHPLI
jgi:hypothetical protein